MIVHEPSLVERCLFGETFVEIIELIDEEEFLEEMGKFGLYYFDLKSTPY